MEVVKIQVERGGSVSAALVDLHTPTEVRIDVAFVDPVDPATSPSHPVVDVDGWEIGALTVLLSAGVTNVTGIDERRVARVRAVLAALGAQR